MIFKANSNQSRKRKGSLKELAVFEGCAEENSEHGKPLILLLIKQVTADSTVGQITSVRFVWIQLPKNQSDATAFKELRKWMPRLEK